MSSPITGTPPGPRSSRLRRRSKTVLRKKQVTSKSSSEESAVIHHSVDGLTIIPEKKPFSGIDLSSTGYYSGNVDRFDDSPYDIPNSQAPVPGREVYWDDDTPTTKKFREELLRRVSLDSPPTNPKAVHYSTPRIKLVPKRRDVMESDENRENCKLGEDAMLEAMKLCREAEESASMKTKMATVEDDDTKMTTESDQDVVEEIIDQNMDSMFLENKSDNNFYVDSPKIDAVVSDEMEFDDFDDDDDSFLIAATQSVERKTANKITEKTMVNPILDRVRQNDCEDVFGSDDSFDMELSQMPLEVVNIKDNTVLNVVTASPILKKRRSSNLTTESKSCPSNMNVLKPSIISPNITTTQSNQSLKKHSSFDSQPNKNILQTTDTKTNSSSSSSFKRIKSSPSIPSQVCSKEEIEQKRREALARRTKDDAEVIKKNVEVTKKDVSNKNTKYVIEQKRKEALARRAASQSQKQNIVQLLK